jgi:aspartate aminotransferase-like enzyme
MPPSIAWSYLDAELRQQGVVVGGNYGPKAGKVFHLGHTGTQADECLVEQTIEALAEGLQALG